MRLLKLRIRNLASLKGEHLINFKEIGSHSPLFAITGETGAGKSTILNSIALVLYGRVYKSSVNQTDLVTLGERDGEAQLIFQLGGKNYLAEWRGKIRNQRTGEYLKKPETSRYIYPLNGEDFSSTRETPIESTEDLLRLDFDQFCKCIILNQGEFARFLSSSFNERKEILEKMYPGEMLESLSRELRAELDTLQKEKNDLDIELETLKGDGVDGSQLALTKGKLENDLKLNESWLAKIESLDFHFVSAMDYHKKHNDNKKKCENIKAELMKETSSYNNVLKESLTLTDAYLAVQKEQEKTLPVLQEFLKSEEMLKQWKESHHLLHKRRGESELKKLNLHETLSKIEINYQEGLKNRKLKLAEIKTPIELLKKFRNDLENLFESFQEYENLSLSLKEKNKTLKEQEELGKSLALELITIQDKLVALPKDLPKKLLDSEQRKKQNQERLDDKTIQEQKVLGLEAQIKLQTLELTQSQQNSQKAQALIIEKQNDILPIETTLKLQTLLNAVEICVTHPETAGNGECPVCHTKIPQTGWDDIKQGLAKTNFSELRKNHEGLQRIIFSSEEELKLLTQRMNSLEVSIRKQNEELNILKLAAATPLKPQSDFEEEFSELQKMLWDQESLKKDESRVELELTKARKQFSIVRDETGTQQKKLDTHHITLSNLKTKLSKIITELDSVRINELKNDCKLLTQFLELNSKVEKTAIEKEHVVFLLSNLEFELEKMKDENSSLELKTQEVQKRVDAELKGKKASELIAELDKKVKELRERWTDKEKENKKIELILKGHQSSIITLEEHLKEIDLLYSKELHEIREAGNRPIPETKTELTPFVQKLAAFSLEISSSPDLFIPFKEKLTEEKSYFKNRSNSLRMEFASFATKLSEWEKKQDRISTLFQKGEKINGRLERLDRLYDILGKDELRTFVLSLVEENLIRHTNEELQKLCSGRYEIIHQRKLEFWILDKYREGGLRKVSTLSGGETFMVSLAMALALAEMTRGQAEIDSLFIDEGFGTLDQESLEDVLDMLQQIQTRGLMVGIISHIKALTQSLQINLLVNKKSDGTSDLSLKFN